MFCKNCGTENENSSEKCSSCGANFINNTDINESQNFNNTPNMNNNIGNNFNNTVFTNQGYKKIDNYLVWSILVTVFGGITCCFGNPVSLVTGIIAIVFSTQVEGKERMGDIQGASSSAKNSKVLIWVSFGFIMLYILVWTFVFAFSILSTDDMSI